MAPTAAGVSISGRALSSRGRGIRNAVISLTGMDGVTQSVRTNAFGYYIFDSVTSGQIAIISADARGYRFAHRVVNIFDQLQDLDLVADP